MGASNRSRVLPVREKSRRSLVGEDQPGDDDCCLSALGRDPEITVDMPVGASAGKVRVVTTRKSLSGSGRFQVLPWSGMVWLSGGAQKSTCARSVGTTIGPRAWL